MVTLNDLLDIIMDVKKLTVGKRRVSVDASVQRLCFRGSVLKG